MRIWKVLGKITLALFLGLLIIAVMTAAWLPVLCETPWFVQRFPGIAMPDRSQGRMRGR